MGRKHCGKRRNCSLRAISSFPTIFSKGLFPGASKGVIVWEWVKPCFTICEHGFILAESVEQDLPAHTCSLILLHTLRPSVINFFQRNPQGNQFNQLIFVYHVVNNLKMGSTSTWVNEMTPPPPFKEI